MKITQATCSTGASEYSIVLNVSAENQPTSLHVFARNEYSQYVYLQEFVVSAPPGVDEATYTLSFKADWYHYILVSTCNAYDYCVSAPDPGLGVSYVSRNKGKGKNK